MELSNNKRITGVDVLRGIAIVAILLIHTSKHYSFVCEPSSDGFFFTNIDLFFKRIIFSVFGGKAYIIFSLLFGFTFALLCDSTKKYSYNIGVRMYWRMVLLILFGVVNAAFFLSGDILIFYAITMMLVIPLRNLDSKILLGISVFFLMQPLEIANSFFHFMGDGVRYEYYTLNNVISNGNFFECLKAGVTIGVKVNLIVSVAVGRFCQCFGVLILGILSYRVNFWSKPAKFYLKFAVISLVPIVVTTLAKMYFATIYFKMYYYFAVTCFIVNIVMYLYYKTPDLMVFKYLSIYGRMSLTNYISQSVICTFIYYPWGLGLAKYCGVTASMGIAMFVFVFQVAFSKFWLDRFGKGPLELIWNKLTWMR